jgi:hypothetical protein
MKHDDEKHYSTPQSAFYRSKTRKKTRLASFIQVSSDAHSRRLERKALREVEQEKERKH